MSNDHITADVAFIKALAELLNANELTEISVKREYGENDTLNVKVSKQTQMVAGAGGDANADAAAAPMPMAAAAPAAAAPAPAAIPRTTPAPWPRRWSAPSTCPPNRVPRRLSPSASK